MIELITTGKEDAFAVAGFYIPRPAAWGAGSPHVLVSAAVPWLPV